MFIVGQNDPLPSKRQASVRYQAVLFGSFRVENNDTTPLCAPMAFQPENSRIQRLSMPLCPQTEVRGRGREGDLAFSRGGRHLLTSSFCHLPHRKPQNECSKSFPSYDDLLLRKLLL